MDGAEASAKNSMHLGANDVGGRWRILYEMRIGIVAHPCTQQDNESHNLNDRIIED